MTNRQLADKANRAKRLAQEVLDAWPDDAHSYSDLETSVECLGRVTDDLDGLADLDEGGVPLVGP